MNPDGRLREYRTIYTHPASGAETQLLTVRPPRPEPVRNLQGTVGTCAFAKRLTQRDIPTARGGAWSAVQVKRVLERMLLNTASSSPSLPTSHGATMGREACGWPS